MEEEGTHSRSARREGLNVRSKREPRQREISNANLRWAATHLASTALAAREFEEALKRRLLKAGVRGRGGDASAGAEEDLKAE